MYYILIIYSGDCPIKVLVNYTLVIDKVTYRRWNGSSSLRLYNSASLLSRGKEGLRRLEFESLSLPEGQMCPGIVLCGKKYML